jgi:hypothetical protein
MTTGNRNIEKHIDIVFDTVPNYSTKWISLEFLRMPLVQKTVTENCFPDAEILNDELFFWQCSKLRYYRDLRIECKNGLLNQKKIQSCGIPVCSKLNSQKTEFLKFITGTTSF